MRKYSTSMYIGYTSQGVKNPVFFDTHTQVLNNKPPGVLITGQPGSGKTYLVLTLISISALLGKVCIIIDPKGDMLNLLEIQNDIGKMNFWNLSGRNQKGVLDPFYMADPQDRLQLVIETIEMFLGGIPEDQMTALTPIVKDAINEPVPSLLRVTEMLRMSDRIEARNLGTRLDLISKMQFAELCFAPGNRNRKPISVSQGVTVVTMVGMELPKKASVDSKLTNRQRLTATIFFLVTDFVRRAMDASETNIPKVLFIDEAWAVLQTEAGARIVGQVALLGRSKQMSLVLVTQNASHIGALDIENTISTRFAFNTSREEARAIVASMEMPVNEGFDSALVELGVGECLMQDYERRFSTVQIDVESWAPNWDRAFRNTNPLERIQNQKKSSQKGSSSGKQRP